MPLRSSLQYQPGGYCGHSTDARQHRLAAAHDRAGYTLVHAGRAVRLGPIAFWVAVGTLVVMAVWTITTATYFAFREDVLTRLIARQTEMQFGYEDRIAELRTQVDRISSRQLLDQEQYEQKLDQILRRQATLESRANALGGLGEVTGSIRQPARGSGAGEQRTAPPKPTPISDRKAYLLQSDREAPIVPVTAVAARSAGGMGGTIARLQASLDLVEQRQGATLNSIAENYDSKARRIRGVLAELGVDTSRIAGAEGTSAMGGPFVPARAAPETNTFERQLHLITFARTQIHRLTRTLGSVPIRRPIDGGIEASSGFGVRSDPFTGSPAMHTGLDLQGDTGDPVRATAEGTVTTAGWSGGYGRVVDIDHGHGLSTRYAHLSSIDVRVGQSVKVGQLVGKIGSTGRSTGPHLHYETRVRGEPVDPQKFLRAGRRLDGSL